MVRGQMQHTLIVALPYSDAIGWARYSSKVIIIIQETWCRSHTLISNIRLSDNLQDCFIQQSEGNTNVGSTL